MPLYRDPGSMLPQRMQDILALIGMRDPRAAIPGPPLMTVGPRAIPLDQPQQYIRNVLGETIGDMADQSGGLIRPAPVAQAMGSKGSEAAVVKPWLDPRLAENAREGFKIPIGDDAAAQEASSALEDRLVTWLANLFYGR